MGMQTLPPKHFTKTDPVTKKETKHRTITTLEWEDGKVVREYVNHFTFDEEFQRYLPDKPEKK